MALKAFIATITALAILVVAIYTGAMLKVRWSITAHVDNPSAAQGYMNITSEANSMVYYANYILSGGQKFKLQIALLLNKTSISSKPSIGSLVLLLNSLAINITLMESYLNQTRALLASGNYTGARYIAENGISMATQTYDTVSRLLSEVNSSVASYLASSQLLNEVLTIGRGVLSMVKAMNNTFASILGISYESTCLRLAVNSTEVYVGSSLEVSGELLVNCTSPLPNMPIYIYLNSTNIALVHTDKLGRFNATIRLPYVYGHYAYVSVVFEPPSLQYTPSSSSINITVLFNETKMLLWVNRTTLWGSVLNITGYVNGPSGRLVWLTVGNITMVVGTDSRGFFTAHIDTSRMAPGNYTLMAYIAGNSTYSPAKYAVNVTIVGVVRALSIKLPTLVFSGLWVSIPVKYGCTGSGTSPILAIGGYRVPAKCTPSGITFNLPLMLSTGLYYITLTIPPSPPYLQYTAYGRVVVINLIQIVVPITAVVALIYVFMRRPSQYAGMKEVLEVPETVGLRLGNVYGFNRPMKIPEYAYPILDALSKALESVSLATGIPIGLLGVVTLREYLGMVSSKLSGEVLDYLRELVKMGEYVLYSGKAPSDDDVKAARELASRITRLLGR